MAMQAQQMELAKPLAKLMEEIGWCGGMYNTFEGFIQPFAQWSSGVWRSASPIDSLSGVWITDF